MNFFSSFSSKRKFTVPADKKGESAKHFGNGAVRRADLARCRVSVEFRHLNIHQHQIELIRRCGAERLNGTSPSSARLTENPAFERSSIAISCTIWLTLIAMPSPVP